MTYWWHRWLERWRWERRHSRVRHWVRWLRWVVSRPYPLGDPRLDRASKRILMRRWLDREPERPERPDCEWCQ